MERLGVLTVTNVLGLLVRFWGAVLAFETHHAGVEIERPGSGFPLVLLRDRDPLQSFELVLATGIEQTIDLHRRGTNTALRARGGDLLLRSTLLAPPASAPCAVDGHAPRLVLRDAGPR